MAGCNLQGLQRYTYVVSSNLNGNLPFLEESGCFLSLKGEQKGRVIHFFNELLQDYGNQLCYQNYVQWYKHLYEWISTSQLASQIFSNRDQAIKWSSLSACFHCFVDFCRTTHFSSRDQGCLGLSWLYFLRISRSFHFP